VFKYPKKFTDRVQAKLKAFQALANRHRTKDVSEADTVTLIKDVLSEVFGYDKYVELTSEQQIRGTYCDLAVKVDGTMKFLIEAKSAGTDLNNNHLRQAVNYGAHQGLEWVILTNAIDWRVYRLKFAQPIDWEEVLAFTFTDLSAKSEDDLCRMFLLSREGVAVNAVTTFYQHAQLLNPHNVAHVIRSEPVVAAIRREMRRLFPDLRVSPEQLEQMLVTSILKRELVEGDKHEEARQRVRKAAQKLARAAKKESATVEPA